MANFEPVLSPRGFPTLPSSWMSESYLFASPVDGTQLYASVHRKREATDGGRTLFICHGQGEHSGRYLHFPHYLESVIDTLVAIDHRGHGRSQGPRGHAPFFDSYVEDWNFVAGEVSKILPPRRRFFFGHSMGGLVLLRLLKLKSPPLDLAIVSAPLLDLGFPVPLWKSLPAELLAKILPRFSMPTGLDISQISRDPSVRTAYKEDPLNHEKASSGFFIDLLKTMEETRSWTVLGEANLKFILPLSETIVNPRTTERFLENLKQPHFEVFKLDEYKHESFNDFGKEVVFEKLRKWLS